MEREIVGYSCAGEQAQKEYLTATDHQFIYDYESQKAFQTIARGIEKKISDLHSFLVWNNSKFWAIQEKLEGSYRRKNVELVVHGFLQNDFKTFEELKQTSSAVLKNIDVLKTKLEVKEKSKTIFTASEIRENLLRQYRSLKKQYENAGGW